MIARRAANTALAWIWAPIAVSSLASWAPIALMIARWAVSTTRGCWCSPSCPIWADSLTSMRRAVTNRSRPSRSGSGAGGASVAKGLGKPGDHLGIDRIILGQTSGRFGEIAHPLGIDDAYRNPRLAQRLGPTALVAAAGLHHRQPDPVVAQPGDQLLLARRRARLRQPQLQRANARLGLQLGNINADNPARLWHPPTPFLARPGARAHATVRVEVQRRAVVDDNRPFAHVAISSGHKGLRGARRTVYEPLSRTVGEGDPARAGWVGEGLLALPISRLHEASTNP